MKPSDNVPQGTAKISLPEQFYIARRRSGLSIVDLAKKSGVHRNTISAIEHGEIMTVRLSTLLALAAALDFDFHIQFKQAQS